MIRLVLPTLWSPRRTILVRLGGEEEKSAETGVETESDITAGIYIQDEKEERSVLALAGC